MVSPDEEVPIPRLLTFLEHGERMAHDCAKAQAALSEDTEARQFLFSQAKQEAAHHGFGRRQLEWAIERGETDRATLKQRAQRYLVLTDAMVLALCDLFERIDEDATAWANNVRIFLPDWCVA